MTDVNTIIDTSAGRPETSRAPMSLGAAKDFVWGTGRRKTSVARVRLKPGSGNIVVNGRALDDYFPVLKHRIEILAPMKDSSSDGRFDILANLNGGGITGQAGALRLGIARALLKVEPALEEALRHGGHLTRDSRMVERKKYGQRKARRRFQFSKR